MNKNEIANKKQQSLSWSLGSQLLSFWEKFEEQSASWTSAMGTQRAEKWGREGAQPCLLASNLVHTSKSDFVGRQIEYMQKPILKVFWGVGSLNS